MVRWLAHPDDGAMHTIRDCSAYQHSALRVGRYALPGQAYLVTFSTVGRRPLFTDYLAASSVCRCVVDGRLWYRSRLLGWVLMPDSWQGLIHTGCVDDLAIVVQRLKTRSTHMLRQEVPGLGRVWSTGFHDRALQASEDPMHSARYLVSCPVRAGLVERVGDYPYWNSVWI